MLNVQEVQAVLNERKEKYGEYAENHKDFSILAQNIFIARDSKYSTPSIRVLLENAKIIKSLMVIKAQRSLVEPENNDHFIDFVNYATFMRDIVDTGKVAFDTGFIFNLSIDAYVKKTIELPYFIERVNVDGIILPQFRKDGKLLYSEIKAVAKTAKEGNI